jgi:alkyl hydroperoxide reductase subunit AhpC
MAIRLGDTAPDFRAETTEGEVSFHEWLGENWGILFSHPADFTPVCTTELGTVAKLKDDFASRGVEVIAVSVDPVDSHHEWISDINETQNTAMNYPIIADPDRVVADAYDMIHPNADDTLTVRTNFKVATPANWQDGDDCIISNSIPDEELDATFPKGHEKIRPYLRTTPQPNR